MKNIISKWYNNRYYLYKFAPYNSSHLLFGSIKYDSNKERLAISQQ